MQPSILATEISDLPQSQSKKKNEMKRRINDADCFKAQTVVLCSSLAVITVRNSELEQWTPIMVRSVVEQIVRNAI